MHATLPVAELVAHGPPTASGVQLVASPVQLGEWIGPGRGKMVPVAMRVPDVQTPSSEFYVEPTVEPKLVGTDIYPRFDYRTIPLLPYGSFWVELTNQTSQPIAIDPKYLSLAIGGKTVRALSDSGAISGRWRLTVEVVPHHFIGRPRIDPSVRTVFLALPILDQRTELPAGGTWMGYVVFDTGAYTADEFNALIQRSPTATLRVGDGHTDLATATFQSGTKPMPVVCLSATTKPSFERCELLAQ